MKKLLLSLSLLAAASVAFIGCVKKDFENPPNTNGYDPQLTVTHSIAQLKAMNGAYVSSTNYDTTLINDDVVISGIVVADDRSGNYYKQIVIQDSTGGIAIDINTYSLYNDYPVGRKIYVKCKGLFLGYNGGTPELGESVTEQKSLNGISTGQLSAHLVKADIGHEVKDTVVSFAAIKAINNSNSPLINRLVTVADSVEFVSPSGLTYTDPSATTNRYISTCALTAPNTTITVRTSNYANFHAVALPTGRGKIRGILTIYKTTSTTPQLILRDTSDVMFYNPNRCGGVVVNPGTGPIITIDSLRKLYPGSGTYTVPGSLSVTGVVISDIDNKNVASGNFVIEDGSKKGITMYIAGSTTYKLGDSVVVDLTGATVKKYPTTGVGALEIDGLTAAKVSTKGSNKTVTPITLTIAQLNAGIANYENVLVRILNATLSGGSTYSGSRTITDATGSMSLYTGTTATFAGTTLPTGPKTVTGIALPYSPTNEIKLRNPAIDVQ